MHLGNVVNIEDLRLMAKRRLPRAIFDFFDGGAEDEVTLRDNRAAAFLRAHGIDVEVIYKVNEGRPNIADQIVNGKIDLVINTPLGRESFYDDTAIRKSATQHGVLVVTTLTAAAATVQAIRALREKSLDMVSLQEIHAAAAISR